MMAPSSSSYRRRHRCRLLLLLLFLYVVVVSAVRALETVGGGGDNNPSSSSSVFDATSEHTDVEEKYEDEDDVCSYGTSKYDALECWLFRFRLRLPDQSFRSGLVTLKLRNLVCTEFGASGIRAASASSTATTNNYSNDDDDGNRTISSLELAVSEIEAKCTGQYEASGLYVSGNLYATVGVVVSQDEEDDCGLLSTLEDEAEEEEVLFFHNGNGKEDRRDEEQTALDWTVQIDGGYMPTSVRTTRCQSRIGVTDLDFDGSMSARIVDLFRTQIARYVTDAVSQQICPQIREQVDPIVTGALKRMRDFLEPYLPPDGRNATAREPARDISSRSSMSKPSNVSSPERIGQSRTPTSHLVGRASRSLLKGGSDDRNDNISDDDDEIVDLFNEAPALVSALGSLNRYWLRNYLNRGFLRHWFPNVTSCGADADEDCGVLFDGVNGIVRALLKPMKGKLYIPVPLAPLSFPLPGVGGQISIDIESVTVEGIDYWRRLQVMEPSSSKLYWASRATSTPHLPKVPISATVRLTVNLTLSNEAVDTWSVWSQQDPFPEPKPAVPIVETIDVRVNASSLDAWIDVDVGMRKIEFEQVTVGAIVASVQDLLWHQNMTGLNCLLKSVKHLTSKQLGADIVLDGSAVIPVKKTERVGALEEDLARLANVVLKLLFDDYRSFIRDAVLGLSTSDDLRNIINNFVDGTLAGQQQQCPSSEIRPEIAGATNDGIPQTRTRTISSWLRSVVTSSDDPPPHFANFSDWAVLHQLDDLMQQDFTLESVNAYADCASRFLSRAVQQTLSTYPVTVIRSDNAGYKAILRDFEIVNVGQLHRIQLLSPQQDGAYLKNSLDLHYKEDSGAALGLSAHGPPQVFAAFDVEYAPLNVSASFNITVSIDKVILEGGSTMHYDVARLFEMTMSQLLKRVECLAVPVRQQWIDVDARLGFFETTINASIITGSSSSGPISFSIDSQKYPSVAATAASALYWTVNSTRDVLRASAEDALTDADAECKNTGGGGPAPSDDESEERDGTFISIFIIMSAVFCLTQPTILLIQRTSSSLSSSPQGDAEQRQNAQLTQPLLPEEEVLLYEQQLVGDRDHQRDTPAASLSLIESGYVPELARIGIPVLVLATIALFFASNLSTGATVDLKVAISERHELLSMTLFEFSLFRTAAEMWRSGSYALFLLVVVFSGIWPYVKLTLMLFSWVARASLPADRRGRLLLALDALGKFSLVDAYVLVLFVVAFHYHLDVSGDSAFDVFVTPTFGFYSFLLATSASLLAGHMLVYYHRRDQLQVLEHPRTENVVSTSLMMESEQENQLSEPEPIWDHVFWIAPGGKRLQLSRRFQGVLVLVLATVACLLGIGITKESFVFEFNGLAGMALDADARSSAYSLITLGTSLSASVENPSSPSILCLQAVYFFYSVITPFSCLFFLAILLAVPLQLERQLLVLTLAEISNAWSAIEVFCLSIIAALLQISNFCGFLLGDRCDVLNEILKDYFHDEDDVTCFSVRAWVRGNAFFLIFGVLLNSFFVSMVLGLAHDAVSERIARAKDENKDDPLATYGTSPAAGTISSTAQWLADSRWTWNWAMEPERAVWFEENDGTAASANTAPSSPPAAAASASFEAPPSPWESRDVFQEEWKEAAERDPSWKEWKEATNVT